MCFRFTPKDLNNGLNEKRRKANRPICDKKHKEKHIYLKEWGESER